MSSFSSAASDADAVVLPFCAEPFLVMVAVVGLWMWGTLLQRDVRGSRGLVGGRTFRKDAERT